MLALLVSMSLAQAQPPARVHSITGAVQPVFVLESKVLGNKRNVQVYLPPEYDQDKRRRYPVLYMHDGQNCFDGYTSYIPNQEWRADETAEALIRAKLVEPIVIVAIDNGQVERGNEYLPTRNAREGYGGKADLYGRMILEELKPRIDREYRTKKGPENTGLIGSSFGGIATLHLGLTHPEAFGKLGVVSPSLWWDDEIMCRRVESMTARLPVKVWLDMGTAEGGEGTEASRSVIDQSRRLAAAMRKLGWVDGRDFAYVEDGHAIHNEVAWARRLGSMLIFLFPAKK